MANSTSLLQKSKQNKTKQDRSVLRALLINSDEIVQSCGFLNRSKKQVNKKCEEEQAREKETRKKTEQRKEQKKIEKKYYYYYYYRIS